MGKKIRFALEMDNGVEVRSLEELKTNFSLARVLGYLKDGKLIIWLRDRYEEKTAEAIEQLDLEDETLEREVCKIFDVLYDENTKKELEKNTERLKRIKRLKQITCEKKYLNEIDKVAFDQDELYDLLDDEADIIYLCGERFSIPLSKSGVSYIGINNPVVVIDSKVEVNWEEKGIFVEGVIFDEKYQSVLMKEEMYEEVGKIPKNRFNKENIGGYVENTYLNVVLSPTVTKEAKKSFEIIKRSIEKLFYNEDEDIQDIKKMIVASGLVGIAENYISRL